MTLAELSNQIGFTVAADLRDIVIEGVASLENAGPEEVSFYADPRYGRALKKTKAAAVLVPRSFEEKLHVPAIPCEEPAGVFSEMLKVFTPAPVVYEPGIHSTAVISESAKVSPSASIQPFAVVEAGAHIGENSIVGANCFIGSNAFIGNDCFLYPGVFVGERCSVGNRVVLHANVVIGSDGFGYEFRDGRQQKIPQTGIVQIDDDVEIGANSTVDRARFGKTHICEGVKIDNLVQIGHNVRIGPHSVLCAHVGISGSTKVGAYVTLAGKVGVNGHIEIGDRVMVGAMSGVVRSLPEGEICAGRPPLPMKEYKRNYVQLRNIHKLYDRVAALEKILAAAKA